MNRLLLLMVAALLAGCAQPNKSFYVLTASGPVPSGGGVGIGVGPVSLAEYIDRPNLVTQEAPNQLAVAEDHSWAGDLSAGIARVVTLDEIKAEDWTLNISRYVLPPLQEDIQPLPDAIAAFKDALTRCREAEERLAQVMTEGGWLK